MFDLTRKLQQKKAVMSKKQLSSFDTSSHYVFIKIRSKARDPSDVTTDQLKIILKDMNKR